MTDGDGMRRYQCARCGWRDKWIPGRDRELPHSIRTGCEQCETIRRFVKAGSLTRQQLAEEVGR